MGASYNKLFKLLIDRKLKKGELCRMARISSTTLAKMAKGEIVSTDIIIKVCQALRCDVGDIMEVDLAEMNPLQQM
jgi:DNA-binding Xre family transcriptional regulator